MVDIKPFRGTRPYGEKAENLIVPSTDYLTEEKKLDLFEKNYWNYLKILNPVGQTKEKDSLKIAKDHFKEMKINNIIKKDIIPQYYIYRIKTDHHAQIGFMAIADINKFLINKCIRGHELTYSQRTNERAEQMLNINTQIGPIYATYSDDNEIDDYLFQLTLTTPQYDFLAFDKSKHTLWCINDEFDIETLSRLIKKIKCLYIADGHHRMAAMRIISDNKEINKSSNSEYSYFMFAAFPASKSKIYDYNRVIKSLNGLSFNDFLSRIKINFEINESENKIRPMSKRNFGMYFNKKWYSLRFKNENLLKESIISKLDINIIDEFCFKPILGIKDANTDDNIRFIAGSHGLEALEKKVDENNGSIAFSIFPTNINDVIEVADNNLTMPPKSTWFDPKPLDGLVVYEFEKK